MNDFRYSAAGLALTKSFEGCRFEAYPDGGGVWTIGYGHTGAGVYPGRVIDQATADALLLGDLAVDEMLVNGTVTVPLQQHQFDALVDFSYNAGQGAFVRSNIRALVNAGNFDEAAKELLTTRATVNGQPCPGLARRRSAESAMFQGKAA